MFRGLPTLSIPLASLFASPYQFTVPPYQRPYSWTIKEATQLLEDVLTAAGLEDAEPAMPDYFLGAILLLDGDGEGTPSGRAGPRSYDVVDGQQRIVTLAILAAVLRDFEDQDGTAGSAGFADRLDAMICADGSAGSRLPRRMRITLRDVEQTYLEQYVVARHPGAAPHDDDADSSGQIKAVHRKLTYELEGMTRIERSRLARYLIEDCHVVVIVSRDIDGAHRLFTVLNQRGKPLDKKDILKAELLRSIPDDEAPAALALWERAQNSVGDEYEDFFSYLRLMHFTAKTPIIAAMRALVRESGSMPFLRHQVTPFAESLHSIRSFASNPGVLSDPLLHGTLVSLNRIGNTDWITPAMLAMAEFGSAPERTTALLVEIERYALLLRLLGLGGDKRVRRFAPIVAAIQSAPETAASSLAFSISRDEQRMVSHHIKDIHSRNAPFTKLLLMRIEEELVGTPLQVQPNALTVEHILPQRPAQSSEWRRDFPEGDIREICQDCLGNLALITPRQNDRAKNRDFPDKVAVYRQAEPDIPRLVSNAAILEAKIWREPDIRARETMMVAALSRICRFEITPSLAQVKTSTKA